MSMIGSHDPDARGTPTSRRAFLRNTSLAAVAAAIPGIGRTLNLPESTPDYRLEIAELNWELAPRKTVRIAAYNSQIPGPLLRVTEGKPVTIDIVNKLDHAEIVHWHGQQIPVDVDGSMEEGSPMIPPGGNTRIVFTPKPAGLHWYHTHAMAAGHSKNDLKHGLYSGQFGVLHVDPGPTGSARPVADYDQEQFVVLHDWEPYYSASDDGSMMVNYVAGSVNGRLLGHDDPIKVREGQRVLFQIVNASATEIHWLSLPGHKFTVLALDGRSVATPATVETLRLGPAERITASVTMSNPGVWILGEPRTSFRDAGMGTVIEYAGQSGKPQWTAPAKLAWDYTDFCNSASASQKPDATIPLVFTSRFQGHGAVDKWMINGKSWPDAAPILLKEGMRHRLVFDNRSMDDHPVHIHRHSFEIISVSSAKSSSSQGVYSGVHKDVVLVEAGSVIEADLIADNPGNTLFHCHQQDHMDAGFMALFRYA